MPKHAAGSMGSSPFHRWVRALLGLVLAATFWSAAAAARQGAELRTGLTQYQHTAWRVSDGEIASEIYDLAQTPDGYLWLAGDAGLLEFDGVRFRQVAVAGTAETNSVHVARDGALWVGYTHEAVRLFNGHATHYTHPGAGRFSRFAEDSRGRLWATEQAGGAAKALCRIARAGVLCVGPAEGFPCTAGGDLLTQPGELLVTGSEGLCSWRDGKGRLLLSGGQFSHGLHVALLRDGSDLLLGFGHAGPGGGLQRFAGGRLVPYRAGSFDGANLSIEALFRDRSGDLWIGAADGVYRIHDGRVDHMSQADGLSGNTVYAIFEDREGSVWIATSGGLDRFRERPILAFGTRQGLSADEVGAVAADRNGALWIATPKGLDRLQIENGGVRVDQPMLKEKVVTVIAVDRQRRLWAGYDDVLTVTDPGGPPRHLRRGDGKELGELTQLLPAANGDMWATSSLTTGDHLYRIVGGSRVEEVPIRPGSGFLAVGASTDGDIWILDPAGSLRRYRDGASTPVDHPFPSRQIVELVGQQAGGLLVASTAGLFALDRGKWRSIDTSNGLPCNNIIDLLRDRRGDLWLRLTCGIVRIRGSDLGRWLGGSSAGLPLRILSSPDGALPGSASSFPQSAQSADGRIWYATDGALLSFDPDDLKPNRTAPFVRIEAVVADGRNHDPGTPVTLPPLTHDLEIDYGPLSLAQPQGAQVRYRLEGLDRDWQSVGARRSAYYTDVPPGSYVFHVIARNADGVCNAAGARIAIEVRPAFYQTWWWMLVVAAAAALCVWLLLRMRLRYLASQIEIRLVAEQGERLRIARELHDTLLQSFHALLIRLQLVANDLPPATPSRHKMDQALDLADRAMHEGRDRVLRLRSTLGHASLREAFEATAEQLRADAGTVLQVTIAGEERPVRPNVQDECYRIGAEAVVNAIKHAQASRISVSIEFAPDRLRLCVEDDGRGFDPVALAGNDRSRHFGIRGMEERAQKLGARFEMVSSAGAGTRVVVEVAANQAYPIRPRDWFADALRRSGGWLGRLTRSD